MSRQFCTLQLELRRTELSESRMFLIITHLMRSSLTFHNSLIIATAYFSFLAWFYFRSRVRRGFCFTFSFFRVSRNIFRFLLLFRYFTYRSIQFFRWLRRTNNFFIFICSATKIIFPTLSLLAHFTFHYFFGAAFIIFLLFAAHSLSMRIGIEHSNLPFFSSSFHRESWFEEDERLK